MNLPDNTLQLNLAVQEFIGSSDSYLQRNVAIAAKDKIDALNRYFDRWGIEKTVVGVSGGVDSALVLALLEKTNLSEIYAVNITFGDYSKVYDGSYYKDLKSSFPCIEYVDLDLSRVNNRLLLDISEYVDASSPRVSAQSSYALRYLAFFTIAQSVGGITVGTTNASEMKYAGWFGKNSDMVVDIQPIADLYKHRVKHMAEYLGVPDSIINRVPTGDLIDGTSDEENFGCTYDELSWFSWLISEKLNYETEKLNDFLLTKFDKVIKLHGKNKHKYQEQGFNPVFI